jgi:hypothetical protein
LHKLIFKCVGIKHYKKLKHTLCISMKKMVHHGKDLLDADGVLKGFGSRIEAIVNWIRKADWLGKAGLALDVICSVPVIEEAFTSEEGDPVKAISAEAARVYGGYLGGNIGYKLGPAIVTAGLGLLAGSSVVGAGIAASPIVVGVGVVVGAVGGAWVGATFLSTVLEEVVTTIYDSRELLSEEGGFFDWNVEQP